MFMIDKAILDTSKVICKNISRFDDSERGLLSQNILSQLRNLVEYISMKIYANGKDIDPNSYKSKVESLKCLETQGKYRFLNRFHQLLQKSVSHYTMDEDGSERLMLKYYEYLLKIKIFLKENYSLEVLDNIEDFPLNTDKDLEEYYEKIADKICNPSKKCTLSTYKDRYYIQKIKPFFSGQEIYYEVTFTTAYSKTSKFDRVIAFTKCDILDNYAVKLTIHNDNIQIMEKSMSIQIIDDWSVSIRPCELNNFADIFRRNFTINTDSNEYKNLMIFLKESKMSLSELINSSDEDYSAIKLNITENAKSKRIFDILDGCRKLVLQNFSGCNIIQYLLYKLNNKIIKGQYWNEPCAKLSNLYLSYSCIPFDEMPYNTSLRKHNPRLHDLYECIPVDGHKHELLARFIRNNTEINGVLFTPKSDTKGFDNIDLLIKKYNNSLYYKHKNRRIDIFKNHLYIREYVDDCKYIIQRLKELSQNGIPQYTNSVDSWLNHLTNPIDCEEKKNALRQMFDSSSVVLIYGSAGTGKSTLISHISNFFADKEKIYLANTNPAVDNMRRKVKVDNSDYKTIATFLSKKNSDVNCDILFVDECSTVSNSDMRKILEKAKFKLLVLVGDIYQIESIMFGNWFSIVRKFITESSVFELTHPYRSTNNNLLLVWDRVRHLNSAILEPLVKNNYSERLDNSIFEQSEDDQIILCLNYDGLYGINNINRFLQNSNPNPAVYWGINIYKVNDPILFNESERFAPLIYNNMKGRIVNIEIDKMHIWFEIEVDISINGLDAEIYDFELMEPSENGNSIIRFCVNNYKSTDEDDDAFDAIVPFQVAYAVSIHKAQGLEYNSVKIVITNEVEERITHNIFYTAITRAKQYLKIYWSPETEKYLLENMVMRNSSKDVALLKAKYPALMN
jgi:hypothetical protein